MKITDVEDNYFSDEAQPSSTPPFCIPPPPPLSNEGEFENDETEESKNGWTLYEYKVCNVREHLQQGSRLSSPVFYSTPNNWPWRLGIHFRGFGPNRDTHLAVFLEMADVEGNKDVLSFRTSGSKKRNGSFKFDIISNRSGALVSTLLREGTHFCGEIAHESWHSQRLDSGFSGLISIEKFTRYCIDQDGCTVFRVEVKEEESIRHITNRFKTTKEETGMVGLENQGATCYLNSLIQILYHLPLLRSEVFRIDTSKDLAEKGVVLEMQHVFANLQLDNHAAKTEKLTKAFGWTDLQVFVQHDVQEMLRELLDKLEKRILSGDPSNTVISSLFSAKSFSYVKCVSGYQSSREEDFFDISLDVLGFDSVKDSFLNYCKEEVLNLDNQYEAPAEYGGRQDALKGIKFLGFPPVLHLHLKRFGYNFELDKPFKIHSRFSFEEEMNLNEFVKKGDQEEEDFSYRLQAVLMHSGNVSRGHYYVYIYVNDFKKWFKFNDEKVKEVSKEEVLNDSFGGKTREEDEDFEKASASKRWKFDFSANAYMLVYIRVSRWDEVMKTSKVPPELLQRFHDAEMRKSEYSKKKEQALYTLGIKLVGLEDVHVMLTHAFLREADWLKLENISFEDFRTVTNTDLYKAVSQSRKLRWGHFRLWNVQRSKYSGKFIVKGAISVHGALHSFLEAVFVEEIDPHAFNENESWGLFVSEYDPKKGLLVETKFVSSLKTRTLSGLLVFLQSASSQLDVFKLENSVAPYKIANLDAVLNMGDIVIYSRPSMPGELSFPNYFLHQEKQISVLVREVNSSKQWRLTTRSDLSISEGVLLELTTLLSVSSTDYLAFAREGGKPFEENAYFYSSLNDGECALVEVLPFPRQQIKQSYCFLVHLPGTPTTKTNPLLFRNDRCVVVRILLNQMLESFEIIKHETLKHLSQFIEEQDFKLKLFQVQFSKMMLLENENDFETSSRTKIGYPAPELIDSEGMELVPNRFDLLIYGELLPETNDTWIPVHYCSSVTTFTSTEDVVTFTAVPFFALLVKEDTLGTFWKRMLIKLCLSTNQTWNWRPFLFCAKNVVFLDQCTEEASATKKRLTPLGDSHYDGLPLWDHPELLSSQVPHFCILLPPPKPASEIQTSLSIRSS